MKRLVISRSIADHDLCISKDVFGGFLVSLNLALAVVLMSFKLFLSGRMRESFQTPEKRVFYKGVVLLVKRGC